MSEPDTRPLDYEWLKYIQNQGGNLYAPTDNSVNRYGPQILLVGILASVGFAFGIASFVYANSVKEDSLAVIKELKTQYRLVDDDWQKQTAWLYAHGVAKDKQGNLYIVENHHGQ